MNCPHEAYCQHKRWSAPDDLTRTTRNWVVGFARRLFRSPDGHYEHTAAPYAQQVRQVPAAGALNPNETIWRKLETRADVQVPARLGTQCALYFVVFAGCGIGVWYCAVVWHRSEYIPLLALAAMGDVVAAVVFARVNWHLIGWRRRNDKSLPYDRSVIRSREADATPTTAPRQWHVKAEMTDESGRHTLYDEFKITNAPAWHRFCKAVQFDGKNFSGAESKRHKVPPVDWTRVSTAWVSNGWLSAVTAGGIPEPKGPGKGWVKAYAETPPEEA